MRWKVNENLPQTLVNIYRATKNHLYPNISCILHLLLVAPGRSLEKAPLNTAIMLVGTPFTAFSGKRRRPDIAVVESRLKRELSSLTNWSVKVI